MNSTSWQAVVDLIQGAKGGDARQDDGAKSFEKIARLAVNIPGSPDLDGEKIRYLMRREGVGIFGYGAEIRATLAALEVPLVDALAPAGWWPDMRWGRGISPVGRVQEAMRLVGLSGNVNPAGNRIIIELS